MSRRARRAEAAQLRAFTRWARPLREHITAGTLTQSVLEQLAARFGVPVSEICRAEQAIRRKDGLVDG